MKDIFKYLSIYWWTALFVFLFHQFAQYVLGWQQEFLDSYLDPFLSMPLLLGLHLAERRYFFRLGILFTLPLFEVLVILAFFAIIFEEGFPLLRSGFVRDELDYGAYAFGGLVFYFLMNKPAFDD